MKRFGGRIFLRHCITYSGLVTFYNRASFYFRRYNSSTGWNRAILCLTENSHLNQQAKKCARRIRYDFVDKVHEPVLLRDCYRDITIIDKSISSTHFWQQYLYIHKHTSEDSDKKLLVIVDAPMPAELQTAEPIVVKIFLFNDSMYKIIETIKEFVRG